MVDLGHVSGTRYGVDYARFTGANEIKQNLLIQDVKIKQQGSNSDNLDQEPGIFNKQNTTNCLVHAISSPGPCDDKIQDQF